MTDTFRQGTELMSVQIADFDPTIGSGVPNGTKYLFLIRTDDPSLYYYDGPLDTDWVLLATGGVFGGNGFISVSDITTLATVDPSLAKVRGVIVLTLPSTQPFFLNPNSTLTPDGITVVAAIGGGNWERSLGSPSPDAQSQPSWYIDPIAGNDENTGLTALTSLKTIAELSRRWGPNGTLATVGAAPIIVNIQSNLPPTDPINTSGLRLGSGQVLIFQSGSSNVLASGTIFAITPQDPLNNLPWTTQGNAGAFNFAPYVGSRVRIVGGSREGTTFTIMDTTGGGLTAIIDNPVILPPAFPVTFGVTLSAPHNGDTFEIIQQTSVEVDQVSMTFELDEPSANPPILTFNNLQIDGNFFEPEYTQGFFLGCKLNAPAGFITGTIFSYGTCYTNTPSASGLASMTINAGCSLATPGTAAFVAFGGASVLCDADTVMYGGGFVVEGGFQTIAQLAVFNATAGFLDTGAGISMETSDSSVQTFGSIYGPNRLWGKNNAMGVSVPPGGIFDASVVSSKTITGAGGDIQLDGKVVARAWDETAGAYTSSRALSWINLAAAIGAGGFSKNAHDVASSSNIITG